MSTLETIHSWFWLHNNNDECLLGWTSLSYVFLIRSSGARCVFLLWQLVMALLAVKSLWKWPIMAAHTLTLSPLEFPTSHCRQDKLADLKLTLQKCVRVCVCVCVSGPSLHYVWIGYLSSYLESAYLQECEALVCVFECVCALLFSVLWPLSLFVCIHWNWGTNE